MSRRIVVLSPHLDDAVFSVGATIRAAAGAGDEVSVVTVFAGEPDSNEGASDWDARAGFKTAGEAARERRREDAAACAALGARAVWVDGTRSLSPKALGARIEAEIDGADLVLAPGFPCTHQDHELAARAVIEQGVPGELALYVEQPYAMWGLLGSQHPRRRRLGRMAALAVRAPAVQARQEPVVPEALSGLITTPVVWERAGASANDLLAKHRASLLYGSQFRLFGRSLLAGIWLYEWGWGGEALAYVERRSMPLAEAAAPPVVGGVRTP